MGKNSTLRSTICCIAVLCAVLCILSGCAASSVVQARVDANPPFAPQPVEPETALWVTVQDSSALADAGGEEFRSLLVALLQSDAALRMADNAESADGILHVHILEVGLTNTEHVGMSLSQGFGSAATGAVLGLAVGSGFGGSGAAWGTGAGVLVGLGVGYATSADNNADTWTLLADVQMESGKQARKKMTTTPVTQSRMAATAQGINLTREKALPTLQDALAQEIVKQVRKESP